MQPVSRKDVPVELTWDLSSIYTTEEEMYQDMEKVKALSSRMAENFRGKLNTPERINACLDDYRELQQMLILIMDYCDLAVSVDYYDAYNQQRNEKAGRLSADIASTLSFVVSELSEQEEEVLQRRLTQPQTISFF